jgi:hypothetical protein
MEKKETCKSTQVETLKASLEKYREESLVRNIFIGPWNNRPSIQLAKIKKQFKKMMEAHTFLVDIDPRQLY